MEAKKMVAYQFQAGDKLKLCLATDKKEAMLVFNTRDANRVNRYVFNNALGLDLFRPHEQEFSTHPDYAQRMIITMPIK